MASGDKLMTENNNNDDKPNEQTSEDTRDSQICSNCGEKNPINNLFCNYCGHHFVEKVKCRRCDREIPVYNTFCGYCGAPMRATQQTTRTTTETPHQGFIQQQQPIQRSYYDTPSMSRLPPEVEARLIEQQRLAKLESRNTLAKIFGIIFLIIGIGVLINYITSIFIYSTEYFEQIIADYGYEEVSDGLLYGMLTALNLPAIVIFFGAGASLIWYKPEGNYWKGMYQTLRFIFVGFSMVLALISIISTITWLFYNPSVQITGYESFWLFYIIRIPVDMKISNLYIALLSVYLFCIFILILPPIIKSVKERTSQSSDKEVTKYKTEEANEIEETKPENPDLELKSKTETISRLEAKKGRMPAIFYTIKNTPLIKTMELLGLSMIVSIILIFILSPFINEETTVELEDPFITVIAVFWAGIFEEISFRLILIGVPMIIVVIVRYNLQNKQTREKIENSFGKLPKSQPKLTIIDVVLSFRGKYKIIGYPEWILVGISSLLFGFAHWSKWTGGWGAWKIVQAAVAGFFLSYAFVKYGLASAIFIHVTNNVISALSIFSAEIDNAEFLAGFTMFLTMILLLLGLMKAVSIIINLVYKQFVLKKSGISR